MKIETFKKRFGENHPALINGFVFGISAAKNGFFYNLTSTKKGIVAKKVK